MDSRVAAVADGAPSPSLQRAARRRRRLLALGLLVVVIGIGLAVHALLPDSPATDITGDALYAAAVYLAAVLVLPDLAPWATGCLAAAWCVAIELFQLTGIPLDAGAAFPPAMLLLGTVFDARDLLVYLLAVAVLAAVDAGLSRLRGRRDDRGSRG